jgi:FG-GAP-like repeat
MRRGVVVLAAAVAWSLAVAGTAFGFGTFGTVHTVSTGGVVYGIAIGDMNHDGKADVLVPNDSSTGGVASGHISLLLGKGSGGFKPAITIHDPRGPEGVAIGDFNGDGRKDFAVANYNGCCTSTNQTSVEIFLGKLGGGFKDTGRISVGPGAWLIRAADLNRDGKIDLVVGDFNSTTKAVAVLLGRGNGTFRAPHYYPSSGGVYGLALGRMNGNKRPDVVTSDGNDTACVLLTTLTGSLAAPRCKSTSGAGNAYSSVALGDFNRDGKLDVALADFTGSRVLTLLGNGNGTLQPALPTSTPFGPNGIVAGDFNRDGKLDVAIGDDSSPYGAGVLLGNGNGTFQAPASYSGSDVAETIAAGRLNADKGLDLLVGTNSGVDVFLNQP